MTQCQSQLQSSSIFLVLSLRYRWVFIDELENCSLTCLKWNLLTARYNVTELNQDLKQTEIFFLNKKYIFLYFQKKFIWKRMKRKLEKIYKAVYSEDILCISLLSEHSTTTSPSSHSTPRWCSRAGSSLSACPAPRPGPWRRSSRMKESTSRAGGPSSSEVILYSIHTRLYNAILLHWHNCQDRPPTPCCRRWYRLQSSLIAKRNSNSSQTVIPHTFRQI